MRLILWLGIVGGLVSRSMAVSFSMDPWVIILEPQRNVLSQVVTLKYVGDEAKNTRLSPVQSQGTSPIPIEMSVLPRIVDRNGKEQYTSEQASPEFVLFPSQFILYPGEEQKVQLQWVSNKMPTKEITFGMIAAQQPVAIDDGGKQYAKAVGQVNILTRYEGIVVIRPSGIRPKITVDSAFASKDTSGNNEMVLVLSNRGTGLQSVDKMKLQIIPVGKNGQADFSRKFLFNPEMPRYMVKNAILADGTRRIVFPWPSQISPGPVQVTPEFP